MGHKIRGLLILCVLVLCASVAHAKGIKMILGLAIDGTIPPAGTCVTAALQLVRDSGVEIIASNQTLDFDVDVTNNIAYTTIVLNPFSGNNFFKVNTTSPISVVSSLALKVDGGAGFCDSDLGPPFASCVLPHATRFDSLTGNIFAGGSQSFADNRRTIGIVTGSTMVLNGINIGFSVGASGGGDPGLMYAFDSTRSVTWFGMASIDGVSSPDNLVLWRVGNDVGATSLQGPVSVTLATDISSTGSGNMQMDTVNSLMYLAQVDVGANTINLRTFDFTLTQQAVHTVNSDFGAPGTLNPNGILWVSGSNELVVCTSNFLIVYSGFPITLKRSIASGCNSPGYDAVNNKLYVLRGGKLTRINYTTLAEEASQGAATGVAAAHRLYVDAIHQFVYAIEQGGPSSPGGTAMGKYDTCSSV